MSRSFENVTLEQLQNFTATTNNNNNSNGSVEGTKSYPSSPSPPRDKDLKDGSDGEKEQIQTVHNPIFKPRAAVVELLLANNFEVISALCEVALIPEEGRMLAEALTDFFDANGKIKKLMQWAVSKEIVNSSSPSTLFRGTNEATKLMSVLYTRIARDYLKKVAGVLVKDIMSSGSTFEVDPNRAEKGIDVKDNLKKIISIANEFLKNIYDSMEECPMFLRQILYYAKKEVSKKFPQCGSLIVGVFFFSRFLIPAIVTPNQYGLSVEPPSMEAQRGLILISKLLQNLSNGIEFDEAKEEYTAELNKFIHDNFTTLNGFYDKLAVHSEKKITDEFHLFNIPSDVEQAALTTITNALKEHQQKIFSLLTKPETKKAFTHIVEADLYKNTTLKESDSNESWMSSLRTRKKKKYKTMTEEKFEKMEKLEQLLEEETRARKAVEKRVADLAQQLAEQKEQNEKMLKMFELMSLQLSQVKTYVGLPPEANPSHPSTSTTLERSPSHD
eukprot:CAMPEP_0168551948 /NCGR_PEP_ID=MMETSP0413-20121227/6452_1 /TAXON_ID=136452 /ORGANISM="Filamoeba nolandi, Strain NC-AS-23-1" /LENGTH=500 /DNA_ID=CAMNT_0008582523 /DNA_START=110 /DNA_END=1612 /DNA_ORIENTATION=-